MYALNRTSITEGKFMTIVCYFNGLHPILSPYLSLPFPITPFLPSINKTPRYYYLQWEFHMQLRNTDQVEQIFIILTRYHKVLSLHNTAGHET